MPIQYHSAVNLLRTSVKNVLDTLSKSEWHTAKESAALKAMSDAYDDTATLVVDNDAQQMVAQIREVMWPVDNPEEDWSPDTLDEIAEILSPRFPPTEETTVEIEQQARAANGSFDGPMLTPVEEAQVIEQSSHSYEPKDGDNG
jgi:hypothetical protein